MTAKQRIVAEFTRAPFLVDNKGLTRQDIQGAFGIDHPDIWFNRANRYRVDITEMPDVLVDYFKEDPDFKVTEEKAS